MASSTGIGKVGNEHHEHSFSASNEKHFQFAVPSSRKMAVAVWFKSVIMCSLALPTKQFFQKQPRHENSGRRDGPSQHVKIEAQLCTVDLYNSSQHSVGKTSINKSPVAAPSELLDSVNTERLLEEPSPTPVLYEFMPHNDSIRLLRLHKGALADPVEFTLEFARLDHIALEYEALSYVWGPDVPTSYIVHRISQKATPVTPNLYEALHNVRWCDRDRLLWVDALCINQEDRKEKGTQVRRMNSIYSRASRVLVWLGPSAGEATGAFGVLCALANEALQKQLHVDTDGVEEAQYTTTSHEHEPIVLDAVPHIRKEDLWGKVMLFFCQAWYTRLWVLQEIVLAREATVVWGDCSISWKHVGAAIESIRANELLHMILATRNLQNAFFMWHLSTAHRNSEHLHSDDSSPKSNRNELFPFFHLLDIARSFEVTDPRDKIYGLLGFSTTDNGFSAGDITPDYTLSTSEVYTQVTRSFIEKDQNLDILALALYVAPRWRQPEDYIDNLPSWAPNFNSKTTAFPISNMNSKHQYSAGFARPMCLLPSPTHNTLRLKGVQLDTIRTTGPGTEFQHLHMIKPYFRLLLKWSIDAGVFRDKIAATLTAGRNRDGRLLSPAQKEMYRTHLMQLLEYNNTDVSAFPAGLVADGAHEAQEALWRFVTYRTPFITGKGAFGLGPREAKEGDAVVVLWGGQCPFVVSAAGDDGQWVLQGECFVQEWMHGEAVQALVDDEGIEDGVFELL
ncbi:uncharacterized protein EKO05_0007412 [Ascochyta rabiei]|uniref:Uncharacterized protein n=1 Tax=Didymella rabiei TaxID=5454 RepID=A0A163HDW3_DIDRA|nr:uncharacterized protein EKO05_0007412 [Ascochyta rabiei]KZM25251.1 hypothetical protein ST47_g3623 [Ascochyta rabiei]UPX17035.1 hypothetical protein EKO05_0007412 [Ascochyta rabiei]